MQRVTVGHHPELTLEEAADVLRRHFAGKYEMQMRGQHGSKRLIVKKNAFIGVGVKLEQEENATTFCFSQMTPWLDSLGLLGCLLGLFLAFPVGVFQLLGRGEEMEKEARWFIENAPEFK